MRLIAIALAILSACFVTTAFARDDNKNRIVPYFYHETSYGSEFGHNPFSSFIHYSIDTLQVSKSFDTEDLWDRAGEVIENLKDPGQAMLVEGGVDTFVHYQIFPTRIDRLEKSKDALPNYFLHLLGGGMLYRKDSEWFDRGGYRFPKAYSAILAMTAEFIQEVFEKKSTPSDDEVADFFIFRPLGILLFSSDVVAEYSAKELRLDAWPSQLMYGINSSNVRNIGLNFHMRPKFLSYGDTGFFLFFGMNTLMGASHSINDTDSFSWGLGSAVEEVRRGKLVTRSSAGLFYDRNGSLLWSLLINGTEGLAVRANIYPGATRLLGEKTGLFIGVEDNGDFLVGVTMIPSFGGLSNRFTRGAAHD